LSEIACPFCSKRVDDILKHFVLVHDIESLEHLDRELKILDSTHKRQREFSKFVAGLQEKRKKNLISAEEYRELASKWRRENQ